MIFTKRKRINDKRQVDVRGINDDTRAIFSNDPGGVLGGAVGLGPFINYNSSRFLMQFYIKFTDRISGKIAAFGRMKG